MYWKCLLEFHQRRYASSTGFGTLWKEFKSEQQMLGKLDCISWRPPMENQLKNIENTLIFLALKKKANLLCEVVLDTSNKISGKETEYRNREVVIYILTCITIKESSCWHLKKMRSYKTIISVFIFVLFVFSHTCMRQCFCTALIFLHR